MRLEMKKRPPDDIVSKYGTTLSTTWDLYLKRRKIRSSILNGMPHLVVNELNVFGRRKTNKASTTAIRHCGCQRNVQAN